MFAGWCRGGAPTASGGRLAAATCSRCRPTPCQGVRWRRRRRPPPRTGRGRRRWRCAPARSRRRRGTGTATGRASRRSGRRDDVMTGRRLAMVTCRLGQDLAAARKNSGFGSWAMASPISHDVRRLEVSDLTSIAEQALQTVNNLPWPPRATAGRPTTMGFANRIIIAQERETSLMECCHARSPYTLRMSR